MKKIELSDHFSMSRILLFSLPSIGMQLVDNTYQLADGYFISNYLGATALAAENLIFPPLAIIAGLGLMFGSGASALISHTMGENDQEKANQQLTLTVVVMSAVAVVLSVILFILMPEIARWVKAEGEMAKMCVQYGRILAVCMPFQILNGAFHPLLITADRPKLGFLVSVINAAVNILLDWLAVGVLGWGMTGAALATGLAWIVSALIPLWFFLAKKCELHFASFRMKWKELGTICYNGASEMADALSYAVLAALFNARLIVSMGEYGVDAYAVSEYVSAVFMAVFFGIAMSINPVVGFHLGQGNKEELRSIRKNGMMLTGIIGVVMTAIGFFFARELAMIFVSYDEKLVQISVEAMQIISFAYMFFGVTTFSASFFTGMGDGTASLVVALAKCLVLPLALLWLLPNLFGPVGIWYVTPVTEALALLIILVIFGIYRKKKIL